MAKNVIKTEKSPKAIGPYSQGIKAGEFVYTAGQIGVDPRTGETPDGVAEQTRQALENAKAILEAAGASMEDVVKTTVFLVDMFDYAEMNKVYATYFREIPPARSCVEVPKLARLKCKVEIELIAYIGRAMAASQR